MEQPNTGSARRELATALEEGIKRDDLVALYQPVVALRSSRPSHLEALVRWNRPGVQLLTPDKFIRIAEETDLIEKLGAWMLNRAVQDCAAWQQTAPGVGVSINVSPRQFDKPGFVDLIDSVVRDAGLIPELLTIEISEKAIDEWRHMLGALTEIRALGARVSLDDVGASDLSLRVLSELPLSELKIDTSLVATLEEEGHVDARLINLIIDIARSLGITAVAEGVDSTSKLRSLQRLGCRYGQGLLFAEPARFSSVVRELVSENPTALNCAFIASGDAVLDTSCEALLDDRHFRTEFAVVRTFLDIDALRRPANALGRR